MKEDMTKDTADIITYLLKSCLITNIATEGFIINTLTDGIISDKKYKGASMSK